MVKKKRMAFFDADALDSFPYVHSKAEMCILLSLKYIYNSEWSSTYIGTCFDLYNVSEGIWW